MAIEISNFCPAAARVTGSANGVGVIPTFLWEEGLIVPRCLHDSNGGYTFFLEEDASAEVCGVMITQVGTDLEPVKFSVVVTDDPAGTIYSVHVIDTTEGHHPDNVNFYIEWRRAPGIPASFPVPTASLLT